MIANDWLTVLAMLSVVVIAVSWIIVRHLSATRQVKAELTGGTQYRALADEYRRLSDTAITAQEHLDLRLTDLSVRMDELRDQMDQMQRILKEVE